MFDIAIVGGGASGMMAAISAAERRPGTSIALLERMDRVGKKLLATGNGRCNLGNVNPPEIYGANKKLIESVAGRFGHRETVDCFGRLGLLCARHESGRIYPYCMQASAVLETLRNAMAAVGVVERCGFHAGEIHKRDGCFVIHSQAGEKLSARRVILTAGGQASPSLGSDGSGFSLAQQLGHGVKHPFPALVQLKSDNPACGALNGIRVNATATALLGGKAACSEEGEIQFTSYGLSGIPVMQLSRFWQGGGAGEMALVLDFMPEYTCEHVLQLLQSRQEGGMFGSLESFLVGTLNKKLGYAVLKAAGCAPLSRRVSSLDEAELGAVANAIKGFAFNITGDMGFKNAQVTAGGVDSGEFDADTLQSLMVPGLYAAGEVLDVYAGCGGHNLQWAWASGHISGCAAAESL